ncbi:MAG: DNA polymerase III subunit delta [Candidatus Margulisbacteria bacterium]|jgi:DNA polymerase-3 subunit delta|nr:DNA polymerase III subunit delta [Candidatus Margulisiibacteriota bacterium]
MPKLYLIYGEENYLLEQSVRELKKQYVDPALEAFGLDVIAAAEADPDRIVNSIQTIPVFAPRRLVLVYDPFFLAPPPKNPEEADAEPPEDKPLDLLLDSLGRIPDGVTAAFIVHGKIDQRKKCFKFFQKHAEIRQFAAFAQWDRAKVTDWLAGYLRGKNTGIDEAAAEFLVETAGISLGVLVNEIEKILTYAAGRPQITLADAQAVASQGELQILDLRDRLYARNIPELLALTAAMLKRGESAPGLLAFLSNRVRELLQIKEIPPGDNYEAASLLKVKPGYVNMLRRYAANYTLAQLKNTYYELQKADLQMKTGRLEPKTALICALAELA